jgi:hypothetical protein
MSESTSLRSSSAKWVVPLCSGLALAAAAAYAVYNMHLYEPLLGRWGGIAVAVAAGMAAGIAVGATRE